MLGTGLWLVMIQLLSRRFEAVIDDTLVHQLINAYFKVYIYNELSKLFFSLSFPFFDEDTDNFFSKKFHIGILKRTCVTQLLDTLIPL